MQTIDVLMTYDARMAGKAQNNNAEIEALRAQLRGGTKKEKTQTNVSIKTTVYERMEKYLKEEEVQKGDFVSAVIDMYLSQIGY